MPANHILEQPLVKKSDVLDEMTRNPQADWTIRDIEGLCEQIGLHCESPTRGSHYKVYSEQVPGTLTIPAARPIKPVYIRNLTKFAKAHLSAVAKRGDDQNDL